MTESSKGVIHLGRPLRCSIRKTLICGNVTGPIAWAEDSGGNERIVNDVMFLFVERNVIKGGSSVNESIANEVI